LDPERNKPVRFILRDLRGHILVGLYCYYANCQHLFHRIFRKWVQLFYAGAGKFDGSRRRVTRKTPIKTNAAAITNRTSRISSRNMAARIKPISGWRYINTATAAGLT